MKERSPSSRNNPNQWERVSPSHSPFESYIRQGIQPGTIEIKEIKGDASREIILPIHRLTELQPYLNETCLACGDGNTGNLDTEDAPEKLYLSCTNPGCQALHEVSGGELKLIVETPGDRPN